MKKKVEKRIIGRAVRMYALHEKRSPHVGLALHGHCEEAGYRLMLMQRSWGPLTKGPYRKPVLVRHAAAGLFDEVTP